MSLSEKEAQIYDRQIRLWGVDAQNRIRNTKILVCGINGLVAEVLKNIVLAGVGHVSLLDTHSVSVRDLSTQFLVRSEHVGKNRAESSLEELCSLNPMVKINVVHDVTIKDYDIVLLSDLPKEKLIELNKQCKQNNVIFMCCSSSGFFGMFFQDLNHFTYMSNKQLNYVSLDEYNPPITIYDNSNQINAVCSVLGGIIGQEIIKVISKNAEPIYQLFLYDSKESFAGYIQKRTV